jgi:hypothetical protein
MIGAGVTAETHRNNDAGSSRLGTCGNRARDARCEQQSQRQFWKSVRKCFHIRDNARLFQVNLKIRLSFRRPIG